MIFGLDQYNYITHGYAATIHKAQGVTVDQSYILASRYMDSHAAYVGMSRHREKAELFWSKEEFEGKQELWGVLGRDRSKDVTLDYMGKDGKDQRIGEFKIDQNDQIYDGMEKTELDVFSVFREQFEREHPELAAQALEEIAIVKEIQEYREKRYEEDAKIHTEFLKEQERSKNIEMARQEIEFISPKQKRVENLIEKYYEFENKFCDMEELGKSGRILDEAKKQLKKCVYEICHDNYAMEYLKAHDKELFKEMEHIRGLEVNKPEKTMGENQEKEMEFDLSL